MSFARKWCRLLTAMVGLSFALTVSSPAFAQDDKAQAVEFIKEANAHTEAGEHRPALRKYKAAFDIMEDPRILYRIGLSYEQLGNFQRAREHLELYLFADPDSEYKDRIEKKIALLQEKEKTLQARIELSSNPAGAQIFVDGENNKAYGKTPITLPVGPGAHTLIIRKGKAEKRIEVTVAQGETISETVELGPDALAEAEGEGTDTTETVVTTGSDTTGEVTAAPGGLTRVDIAPPTALLVIGWALIGISSTMFLVWGFADVANAPIAYAVATASLLGGGWILWFGADSYTDDLDRIGMEGADSQTKMWGAGYQWTF